MVSLKIAARKIDFVGIIITLNLIFFDEMSIQ